MFGFEQLNETTLIAQSASMQLLYSFLFGLLSSITPCVYPLIPITLSIFGAIEEKSKLRSFLLSLCYVLGIAATYTVLGLLSASTGALFGAHLGSPYVLIPVTIILLLIGLNTLEVLDGKWISKLQTMSSNVGGKGFGGAFVMGTVSGFVAAPCVGPFLAVLLVVAASSASSLWGGSLFFCYALGMGIPFLILGTFTSLVHRIPRSGNWLLLVKFFIAVLVFDVIFFLVNAQISFAWLASVLSHWALPAVLILGSCVAAYYAFLNDRNASKILSTLVCSLAIFSFYLEPVDAAHHAAEEHSAQWLSSTATGLAEAQKQQKILMVDVYADWCAACKELEAHTFPDAGVQAALADMILVRANYESEESFIEQYEIVGLPAILFIDASGKEIKKSRISGYLEPEAFVQHVKTMVGP